AVAGIAAVAVIGVLAEFLEIAFLRLELAFGVFALAIQGVVGLLADIVDGIPHLVVALGDGLLLGVLEMIHLVLRVRLAAFRVGLDLVLEIAELMLVILISPVRWA